MIDYPWQEPSYVCETDKAVRDLYDDPGFTRELYGKNRFANTSKLLGNPYVDGFHDANIVPLVVPGFGPNKSQSIEVEVHRKLAPLFLTAFEKIKEAKLAYVLHTIGGYFFRYQQNKDVKAALINRPEYADLKDQPGFHGAWNVRCALRDRQNQAFDEVIPYRNGTSDKRTLLSNHAFGSAIDINATRNDYDVKARFDMPKRIVKIFESLGFYWGGYYHDYMHFEYERSSIVGVSDEAPPLVLYPFSSAPRRESPLKYYFLNEKGKGGYFPLGKQQNLHAGVHVEPDLEAPRVPVKASMPGYVVAARLMTPGKEGNNELLRSATEGRPMGFVLLRHELTDPKSSTPDKVYPLYSLYMHLDPPKWGGAASDKELEKAPWLAAFLKMQHGAVVNLNAARPELVGKTFWAEEKLVDGAESYKVRDVAELFPASHGGKPLALSKPTPTDVAEAIEALKKGSVITFDRPLFPVAAEETVGFLAPGEAVTSEEGAPRGNAASGATAALPRYLHWELFSPSGAEGGLQFLVDKDPDLKALLQQVEEQEKKDNFLQMPSDGKPGADNDVHAILGSTGVQVVKELRTSRYSRKLQEHFNDGKTFFSAQETREQQFTWPLPLTLENQYKFAGDAQTACTLEVLYKKDGQPLSTESFTLQPKKDLPTLSVVLNVPAAADSLSLWSPVFFADMVEVSASTLRDQRLQSRTELFKKVARHRWRNLVLSHVNEWTPTGLGKQLEARKEAGFFAHLEDTPTHFEDLKKMLLPLCWWDRPATREDPFGEVPVPMKVDAEGKQNSLFGSGAGQLPKDATVVNMHPVTALWLADLLLEKEAIAFKKEWPPGTLMRDESTQKPRFLGVLSEADPLLAGTELVAILVQHGYGTTAEGNTPDVTFWLEAKGEAGAGKAPQALCGAPYKEGVALGRFRAPSWGAWEVYATGADGQRFEPVQSHATTFEIPKPELLEQPLKLGSKPGKFRPLTTGALMVKNNWPAALAGYVVFDYWKLPPKEKPDAHGEPTPGTLAMPVTALRPKPQQTEGGLKYEKDFIVGKLEKNPQVTTNFSFKEFVWHQRLGQVFQGDATKEFKLAVPLAQRLQELRDLCTPRALQLTVKRLDKEGRILVVVPTKGTDAALTSLVGLLPSLKVSPFFTEKLVEAEKAVRITYTPPPPTTSGPLHFEFDPAPALGRLAAQLLSDQGAGETLHVRPRLIVPASGHAVHSSGGISPVEGLTDVFSASAQDLKNACAQDVLELVADMCLPPVARFEFGDIQVKMGAGVIRAEVKLHGDANAWKAAEPVFKLKGTVQNQRRNGLLVGEWPLLDKQKQRVPELWNEAFQISAEVAQPDKVAAPPPPVKLEQPIKLEPCLEKLTYEIKGKDFQLKGQGHFIPTNLDFRIVCERQDPATGEWVVNPKINTTLRYARNGEDGHGVCSELGLFEASVPVLLLKKIGGPFRFHWRRRRNQAGAALHVLAAVIEEPEHLEVTDTELGP